MAYVYPNYKSKAAVKRGIANGDTITVQSNAPMGLETIPENGVATVEGPHYPKPHMWYGEVTIENGQVTAIK